MKRTLALIWLLFSLSASVYSQINDSSFLKPSDTLNKPRRNTVVIAESSFAALSLIGLNQLWYSDFETSGFHTINDFNEWKQMDKVGHIFSSYQIGRLGANVLNWSGVSKKDQLIYGGSLGFAYLGVVEIFDGYSREWGFSWSDIAANALGSGLYISQELLWNEQRITMKYSFHQSNYSPQNPNKLGNGFLEEMIKDYNGQTFWLSFNLRSFFKNSRIPKWLNLALGYGAEGMLTGLENSIQNELLNSQNHYRQFYLSLDVDLTKIQTKSHFLQSIIDVFNLIKVPFPTLEFNGKNGIKGHYIYF